MWPRAAEARNRCDDDVLAQLAERLIAEVEAVEIARSEVLDHDIGSWHQLAELLAIGLVFEIEGDAALAGVLVEEVEAAVGAWLVANERRYVARGIAAGRLDLDDVRAQVGQQLRAVGAHLARQVEHTDAF